MKVFGILNITNDSFSDGGDYLEITNALDKIDSLILEGADTIDIGAQSSNINSIKISEEQELTRLTPIIQYLKDKNFSISIDTYKPKVIEKCLDIKVDFINNIKAFNDFESFDVIVQKKNLVKKLILMYSHNQTDKAELNSMLKIENIIDTICHFFDAKIEKFLKAGLSENCIIIDPGMGLFLSEDPMLSFEVLKNITVFKKRFSSIMVSISRKSFLGNILGGIQPLERKSATLAGEIYLYSKNIDYLRTHDVLQIKQSMKIWDYLHNGLTK